MSPFSRIRLLLALFTVLLLLSGITAFPLQQEINWLFSVSSGFPPPLRAWVVQLHADISVAPRPLLYGTDWLAFAHIVIALFFIPVYVNPVRYMANLEAGMAACILVFPLAFICGPLRDIPFFHQLIDCSFGLFGFFFLFSIRRLIKKLNATGR